MGKTSVDVENCASLTHYLRTRGEIGAGDEIDHHVLSGGVSNKAVLVRLPNRREWVIKQALPKLRVATEWLSDPSRVHREAAGMRALSKLAPEGSITEFIFEDFDQDILAMSAVPQPHENLKTLLLQGKFEPNWIEQFASILAAIHRKSFQQREALSRDFEDRQFFQSLRVEPYYQYSGIVEPRSAGFYAALIAAMSNRSLALVHGDYSPKNVLVREGRLILLDHEVIHWGDPAFDVGFSMAHLLSKAHHLRSARNEFLAAAILYQDRYLQEVEDVPWRDSIEEMSVHHTLACLMARVVGRSLLEYFSADQRERQRSAALVLMEDPPRTMRRLADAFEERISRLE
jgi:aminoglycoside phosphotransferase (APT) family kinase protein